MKICIMVILLLVGVAKPSMPVLLTESLEWYNMQQVALTDAERVVFVGDDRVLMSVSLEDPEDVRALEIAWGGLLDQWDGLGQVWNVSASTDGSMICFTQFAWIPEGYFPDSARSTPSPLIVVCCGSDGSDPRVLGLSWDIGYPKFSFTEDMSKVFSHSWYGCFPTPQGWVDLVCRNQTTRPPSGLFVSIEDGSRSGDPSLHPRHLLFDNPLSDSVFLDPDQPSLFLDTENNRVVTEDWNIVDELIFEKMVLPNAFLARFPDDNQIVRFASGQEYLNPGSHLDVYCMLSDGRYIFTRDAGETVLVGEIDWRGFLSPVAVEVPRLSGLDPQFYPFMESTQDGRGVVYSIHSRLYYLEF